MINKSYKIWIVLFLIINLLLLIWSLGHFRFLEEKLATQDNIIVIEPDNKFKKSLPPEDESFPNEKSKVWGAFEDKQNQGKILQNDTELDNVFEDKSNKKEDNLVLENTLENEDNKSLDGRQIDIKPSENKILEKNNSLEEKKLKSDLKTNSAQIQNKSKNNDNLEGNNADKAVIFYVQVASLSKKNLVDKEWNRFKKKHFEYMKNLIYISQKAELKDNRIFFRLLVGKFKSKNEANEFCNKLSISKCIIKKIND